MNSTFRTAGGAVALLAGLLSAAACNTSSPPAGTSSVGVTSVTAPASAGATGTGTAGTGTAAAAGSPTGTGTGSAGSAQREVNPAGDIPDSQAFVPYTSSVGKFTVTVPEGWARTETKTGVQFTDKYNSITVETRSASSAPTTASLRSTELPVLSRSTANFVLGDVTTVSRKAGTAVLLTYRADTPPNPVTGKVTTAAFERYAFFKSGTEVLITLGAPVGGDNVDPWRKVTDSFSWLT